MPIEQTLRESAQSVLETMFFAEAESVAAPSPAPAANRMFIQVAFGGHRRGRFSIGLPVSCARALAGGFEGLDDLNAVPVETVQEVACELANIICGVALTRLDTHGLFTLDSPAVIRELAPAGRESDVSECWLQLPCPVDGLIHLAMAMEAPAMEKAS